MILVRTIDLSMMFLMVLLVIELIVLNVMISGYGLARIMEYLFIIGRNIIMKNSLLLIFTVIFSSCTLLSLPIISKDDTKIDITYDYYYLNDSKLLLNVSALIPYEELIFTKDIDSFYSDIVYSVKLRDKNNDMLYSDSWSDLIRLQYFEKMEPDCWYYQKSQPAHLAPFLCHSFIGRRCRSPGRSGNAGSCRYFHHTDLYPFRQRTFKGGPSDVSSTVVVYVI